MKKSEFAFDSVDLLYYKLHKINLNRGGLYIDPSEWLKDKKATINPKNNDYKCFKYAVTLAFNHEQIKKDPQRITKTKPSIDQYIWKEIDFPSHKKDQKKFKLNDKSIAFNILHVPYSSKKIRHKYKLKYNLNCKIQAILLTITDGEK